MPLVRVSVFDTMPVQSRKVIADAIYDAMHATLGIPDGDRFVLVSALSQDELFVDSHFMHMQRTAGFVLVHVTLRSGRSIETKQSFYREIVRLLQERAKVAPDDVMIVLSENELVDWSFGRGEAQYILTSPAAPIAKELS